MSSVKTQKVKVNVDALLERVVAIAASDTEKWEKEVAATEEYNSTVNEAIALKLEGIAAELRDGTTDLSQYLSQEYNRGTNYNFRVSLPAKKVLPVKPDHSYFINLLKMASDDTITVDNESNFSRYLRG